MFELLASTKLDLMAIQEGQLHVSDCYFPDAPAQISQTFKSGLVVTTYGALLFQASGPIQTPTPISIETFSEVSNEETVRIQFEDHKDKKMKEEKYDVGSYNELIGFSLASQGGNVPEVKPPAKKPEQPETIFSFSEHIAKRARIVGIGRPWQRLDLCLKIKNPPCREQGRARKPLCTVFIWPLPNK